MKINGVYYLFFVLALPNLVYASEAPVSFSISNEIEANTHVLRQDPDVLLQDLFPCLQEHFSYTQISEIAQPIYEKPPLNYMPAEFNHLDSEFKDESPVVQLLSYNLSDDSGANNAHDVMQSLLQPTKSVTAAPKITQVFGITKRILKKYDFIEPEENPKVVYIKKVIEGRFANLQLECCKQKIPSRKLLLAHFRRSQHMRDDRAGCPYLDCPGRRSDDYLLLAEHYITHFDPYFFKCPSKGCKCVYQTSRVLIQHYRRNCTFNN